MAARLQRDEEGRTARGFRRLRQCVHFGMRSAEPFMMADAHRNARAHDDRADHRIGFDRSASPLGFRQRAPHPEIVWLCHRSFPLVVKTDWRWWELWERVAAPFAFSEQGTAVVSRLAWEPAVRPAFPLEDWPLPRRLWPAGFPRRWGKPSGRGASAASASSGGTSSMPARSQPGTSRLNW